MKRLHNMRFRTFVQVNFLLLFFSWCSLASALQITSAARSLTYGFVSPNTREGLKLDDAIRGLHSAEEGTLIRRARSLGCVARSKVETYKAVGSWSDGAEHSVLLRSTTDTPTVRYIVSVLGRNNQQKAALYFHSNSAGSANIYILRLQRGRTMRSLASLLDQAGIEFRTLVPTKASVLVYIVDLKREMRTKVLAAATKLKAHVTSRRGTAEFIGDDSSRDKAKEIFENEIRNYESQNSALITKCRVRSSSVQP